MKKEMIICSIVVILIFVLNIITQSHTDGVMKEIDEELSLLREELFNQNEEASKEKIQNITEKWEKKSNILSYYLEHDELEKVTLYITEIKSNIDTKEYNMAVVSLDSSRFIIDHIKEKYSFSLKNIF